MTDAFADVVMPIFQKVLHLLGQLSWGESRTPDEVLQLTRSWIEEGARRTVSKPELSKSYELAKYGLVGWIDDLLTESTWGANNRWSVGVHLLEWSIFESRIHASKFYEEAKRAEDERDYDALEVYLLCVNLGFKGIMAYDEDDLSAWVERVYGRVSEAGSIPSRPFAEDDQGRHRFEPLKGPALLVTVSILVSLTALLTLAAYLASVHVYYFRGG
jgi:type VI secretion system protein ImpK